MTNERTEGKMCSGPFGDYRVGSTGAVLNALCEQEGRPVSQVGCWAIGNGKVWSSPTSGNLLATFHWVEDDIVFEWVSKTV